METNTIQDQIQELNKSIRESMEELYALKRQVPGVEVQDYTFHDRDGKEIKLSELFGDSDELMLVHNMGKSCRYCTLWADTINGFTDHLENRTSFVLSSPDNHEVMKEFADSRNWRFPMVSTEGTSFKKDVGFESEQGVLPGVSVFKKKDGKIWHTNQDFFGPGDPYCGIWWMFELLENSVDGWAFLSTSY